MPGWLDTIGNVLQKPQSMLTGGILGVMRDFSPGQDIYSGFHPGATTPWAGIMEGWRHKIQPSDLVQQQYGNNTASGIAGLATNLTVDPLMMLGGLAKGGELGSKAAVLADEAFSAGKVPEGQAKLATLLARGGRRALQGTIAAGGNPAAGFGLGMIQGGLENAATKMPALAERLGGLFSSGASKALADAPELADTLESVPSAVKLNPADFVGTAQNPGNVLEGLLSNAPETAVGTPSPGIRPSLAPVEDLSDMSRLANKPASVSDLIGEMYQGGQKLRDDELTRAFLKVLRGAGVK